VLYEQQYIRIRFGDGLCIWLDRYHEICSLR